MRVENMSLTIVTHYLDREPDDYNNTEVRVDGKLVFPVYYADNPLNSHYIPPKLSDFPIGGAFSLDIPSGHIEGKIASSFIDYNDDNKIVIIISDATWDGKANGFARRLSGFGRWTIEPSAPETEPTVVESSAIDVPVPYDLYEDIRRAAHTAAYYRTGDWIGNGELIRKIMRKLFRVAMSPDDL